jgi:hypothetical protein
MQEEENSMEEQLPKLLFVSDVPIKAGASGSVHLYRLLRKYPSDHLLVAERSKGSSEPDSHLRLPNARYISFSLGESRLEKTRFHQWYSTFLYFRVRFGTSPRLERAIENWKPDAILCLWHAYSWLTAARLAEKYDLPLHIIAHDDMPTGSSKRLLDIFKWIYQSDYQSVYRQASSRLCVSPYMEEEYRERYGVSGTVVYPMRNWQSPQYTSPPARIKEDISDLTIV